MVRAYVLAVFCLAVFVVLLVIFASWIRDILYQFRRRRKRRGRPLSKALVFAVTMVLLLVLSMSAKALVHSVRNVQLAKQMEKEDVENGEVEPADIPKPATPAGESAYEPFGPICSVAELYPSYFRLSTIQNSEMLMLFQEISPSETITASGLKTCGEELDIYLESCAHPRKFFRFYSGLEPLFPKGNGDEDVEYAFEDVSTYKQSMAQIRGSGNTLENCWKLGSAKEIFEACHHLAIRAKDALYFGKNEGVLTDQMTWVLGEIAFAALINEYVYGELIGSDLSDWHYRMAQILEYVGDIADTKELRQRLYYVAAVCYFQAYGQISGHLAQAGGEYGNDIWDAYFEMVYKVVVWTDSSIRKEFFVVILEGEMDVEDAGLSETVVERTRGKLKKLDSYRIWKESEEGIEAARELAAQRRKDGDNG